MASARRAPRPATAEVVLIPKHLRMDWMDAMVTDVDLAPVSLKVAGAIGTHFGNKSGMTYVSQKKVAKVTGLSEATVKRAIIDLEQRGYIIIQRREIGERVDGRKVYGGKGIANVYLPAVDKAQISATDRGQKLVAMVQKSWEDVQNEGAPKQVTDDLLNVSQSRSNTSVKQVIGDLPTLPSPSEKDSSRAREPSRPNGLGPPGSVLRQRLGPDVFDSWFGKVTVVSETPEIITLLAPSPLYVSRIQRDYQPQLLAAWQAIVSSVKRIEVICEARR